MLFKDIVFLIESSYNNYVIRGYLRFLNPYGTGPKQIDIGERVVQAYSGEQAVHKLSIMLAKEKKFVNKNYQLGRGYKVDQMPNPPQQTEFNLS